MSEDDSSPLSRWAKTAGYIIAISGAAMISVTTWTQIGTVFAFRSYVDTQDSALRGYVDEQAAKINMALAQIVVSEIEAQLDLRDRLVRQREGQKARLVAATDAQVRRDLQDLIDQSDRDIAGADARIVALERLRAR